MELVIQIAGIGHFILSATSFFFPRLLNWKEVLSVLPLAYKQNFIVYAGYILGVNVVWGVLSVFYTDELLTSSLGSVILLVIALYWTMRIVLQFFYFDMSAYMTSSARKLGLWGMILGIAVFAGVYWTAFVSHF